MSARDAFNRLFCNGHNGGVDDAVHASVGAGAPVDALVDARAHDTNVTNQAHSRVFGAEGVVDDTINNVLVDTGSGTMDDDGT